MKPGIRTLDLHGKTTYQARVLIDAALRRSAGIYRLRLIHGYGHNTALKDMIHAAYAGHPAVLRLEAGENPGQTELVLKEYYG
ncbi:MAG: Smr/MutS family protein [Christensenellaceae bacterium]|jgi:DNA-nicking Smr family endonuclease|nr:Smr/MutS family protein [Christensenellaceae bacterium]